MFDEPFLSAIRYGSLGNQISGFLPNFIGIDQASNGGFRGPANLARVLAALTSKSSLMRHCLDLLNRGQRPVSC